MKFGVITFPGSNCDQDMIYVLKDILGQEVEELWHKDTDLKGCDAIVLPGGFSYGDYLRSGAIARFSPVMTMGGLYLECVMVFRSFVKVDYYPERYFTTIIKNSFVKMFI
jgi:hypothetical protein